MGILKALKDPKVPESEKRDLRILHARYTECDKWAKRALHPLGILITSHPANRAYLKGCVETHKKLGYWMVLSYDNYFDPRRSDLTYDMVLPPRDVLDLVDTFIMPHHQTWGGVLYPYFWLLKFGLAAMRDFEYVYCTNGDCIIEKPENFQKLIDMLDDGDIMGCGWEKTAVGYIFNTTAFIAKTSAAQAILKHFQDHFIPFEMYDKHTQEYGNCERRFAIAIEKLGLKNVIVKENPFNTQMHKKGHGTWYKTIGFRHIHAEHGYAYKYHDIPPELELFDGRYMSDEYQCIKDYWETKDIKHLEKWWK